MEGPVLAGGSPLTLLSRPQEGPEAELLGGERSVFYLLMKMFVASAHSQLKSSTKRLIVKVSTPAPACSWLQALSTVRTGGASSGLLDRGSRLLSFKPEGAVGVPGVAS